MADEIEEEAAFFLKNPWTASYLQQKDAEWTGVSSRMIKRDNEDALMGTTLNTDKTITNCLTVYKKPAEDAVQIEQTSTMMHLGPGMDGWPQVLHGGIVSTLLDEAMGILITINNLYHWNNPGRNEGPNKNMAVMGGGAFTATLNISYKAQVVTPGSVVITASYVRREGRKDWIRAELKQHKSVNGGPAEEIVCAVSEALFIARRAMI